MTEIQRIFNIIDTNANGSLDRAEISGVVATFGLIMTDKEKDEMFAQMDTDHDDQVSYSEFTHWWHNGTVGLIIKTIGTAPNKEK